MRGQSRRLSFAPSKTKNTPMKKREGSRSSTSYSSQVFRKYSIVSSTKLGEDLQDMEDEEDDDDDDNEDEDKEEEEEEEDELYRTEIQSVELVPEYWQIQKFVKYLRIGNQTCTAIALVGLKDFDLQADIAQVAFKASVCHEILLNILRTSSLKCIIGSLQVLELACGHRSSKAAVYRLGGLQALQDLICHRELVVAGLAASVLARVCVLPSARKALTQTKGIQTLVDLMHVNSQSLSQNPEVVTAVIGAARAVWACSVSKTGRQALLKVGVLKKVNCLLETSNHEVLIPLVGILHNCLIQCTIYETSRWTLLKEDGISTLVMLLEREAQQYTGQIAKRDPTYARDAGLPDSIQLTRKGSLRPTEVARLDLSTKPEDEDEKDQEPGEDETETPPPPSAQTPKPILQRDEEPSSEAHPASSTGRESLRPTSGASAQTPGSDQQTERTEPKSAESKSGRYKSAKHFQDSEIYTDDLLEAVTAALWHLACTKDILPELKSLNAVPILVALLEHTDEKVVTNVVGTVGELATDLECCSMLQRGGGIICLIQLLHRTSSKLLLNVTHALDVCARDSEALSTILSKDGLRLLWSHLKNLNENVQASAASAICTFLKQEKVSLAEDVRSLVGGIELLVSLLESPCEAVLSAVCAAIARIAEDPQNLAIMTDYGAVTCLSRLAVRENDTLRPFLAEAIAACCVSRETGLLFGEAGAVAPLVQYLETNDSHVRRPTCRALHRLSLEPENCVTLHQSGAVPLLLEMLASEDEVVQEAAADCLRNIRLLALQRCKNAAAKFRFNSQVPLK